MTGPPPGLAQRVGDWLADDPDPVTRAELHTMLDAAAHDDAGAAALADRFSATLTFGTAGLRAPLGAGPTRMNRVTVSRAAAGLARWIGEHDGGPVVVGRDARTRSDVFAVDVAEVVRGAGLPVHVLPRPLPTPVLAFAVRALGAAAGVMVTASHNPATDNGLKVYLADGSQVVPPADAEIAQCIDAVGRVRDLPRAAVPAPVDESVVTDYVAAAVGTTRPGPRDLRIVTTALHGVGGTLLQAVLQGAGFTDLHHVVAQQQPDPGFPTVAFPNPEEPGALDLALQLARDVDADVVLALDPDADRCAVAVSSRPHRTWRVLTGDEVGCLLGEQRAAQHPEAVLATTLVSSSRLAAIARRHHGASVTTLTGFKWLARVPGLTFAYEEALGYCVDPQHVADKDGITAALAVADLAARRRSTTHTLLDGLDELDTTYGVHATAQVSVRGADLAILRSRVRRLADRPPTQVGGLRVQRHDDLGDGVDGLPPTEGLRLDLDGPTGDGRARLVVRPSGTEPKVKAYLEVVVPVGPDRSLPAARSVADASLARLRTGATTLLTG